MVRYSSSHAQRHQKSAPKTNITATHDSCGLVVRENVMKDCGRSSEEKWIGRYLEGTKTKGIIPLKGNE